MKKISAILLTLLLLIVVNLISYKTSVRFDMTENKMYTLSDSTKNVLWKLPSNMEMKVFLSKQLPSQAINLEQGIKDYVNEFKAISKWDLDIEFIDPKTDTEWWLLAKALWIQELKLQIIEKDQQSSVLAYIWLAVMQKKSELTDEDKKSANPLSKYEKYEVIPYIQDIASLEYDLVSALIKMTQEEKVIWFLTWHNEHSFAPIYQNYMDMD